MALALLAVGGCGEQPPPGILPDSTYVAVMARLGVVLEAENAAPGGRPSFDPDSAREAILAAYGVSSEELSRYAERYGGDPDRMHEIWAGVADAAQALRTSWTSEEGVLELPADIRAAPEPEEAGDEEGEGGRP